jgi:hypothetical protein
VTWADVYSEYRYCVDDIDRAWVQKVIAEEYSFWGEETMDATGPSLAVRVRRFKETLGPYQSLVLLLVPTSIFSCQPAWWRP